MGLGVTLLFTVFAARDTYLIPLTPRSALFAESGRASLLFDPTDSPKFAGGLVTMRDLTQYGTRGAIIYGRGKPPRPAEIRDGISGKVIDQTKPRYDLDTPVWFILDAAGDWSNPTVFTDQTAWLSALNQISITPAMRTPAFWQADLHSIAPAAWMGLVASAIVAMLAIVRWWRVRRVKVGDRQAI